MVNGGFAEVEPGGLDRARRHGGAASRSSTAALLAGAIKDTEEDVADATDDWKRDKLAHKLEQLKALQAALSSRWRDWRT